MGGSINELWQWVAKSIKRVAKEFIGENRGSTQTWWWAKGMQELISKKKYNLKKDKLIEDWVEYKSLSEAAKSAVIKAKLRKYDELYERLEMKEGEKEVFWLPKSREKQSRDFKNVWLIKNEDKRVLTKETEVIKIWKESFKKLLNEEFPREEFEYGRFKKKDEMLLEK